MQGNHGVYAILSEIKPVLYRKFPVPRLPLGLMHNVCGETARLGFFLISQ